MPETTNPCGHCRNSIHACVNVIVKQGWHLRCCLRCTHTTADIRAPFLAAWRRGFKAQ